MKIKIETYTKSAEIETGRRPGTMYKPGAMICKISPWDYEGCPLTLEIAICPDGEIIHRGWDWSGSGNSYLHTSEIYGDIAVTEEMRATISGLFSGRILVDGIELGVGASIQKICPLDLSGEASRAGKEIHLA